MKKFIFILTTALLLSTAAKANISCGIEPQIKPAGCYYGQAVCSCSQYGCSWQFTNCR